MESLTYLCPVCRMPLKLRQAPAVYQPLDCPDCLTTLEFVPCSTTSFDVELRVAAKPDAAPPEATGSSSRPKGENRAPGDLPAGNPNRVPQIITAVGIVICILLAIPLFWPSAKPASDLQQEAGNSKSEKDKADKGEPTVAQTKPVVEVPATAEGRLKALGTLLAERVQKDQPFPAGTVAAPQLDAPRRLSWLAELVAAADGPEAPQPLRDRAWNDPAQENFVRRSQSRFQNPSLPDLVGEDGYPATHYVGISGVGADAADLPVDHPRAGVFGCNRSTKASDIKDGLSNTVLMSGVSQQLGSWASASASVRAVTGEPFVNGPDGFGTGQPDQMFVLMADGSVRAVSSQVSPRIARRWAAIADGLPLDPDVPGEPGDAPATTPSPPVVAENKVELPPEVPDVPAEPEPPPLDIAAALKRTVQKFEQKQPAAVQDLLLQIEELATVPIEFNREGLGDAARRLDQKIAFTLNDSPTLARLLQEIVDQAQLAYRIEARRIVITTP